MNLSGILVVARPERQAEVVGALSAMEGVEVHQVDAASGRIIAVQEAPDIHAEIEGVKRIKALPDVIMAEMVNHYIGDDAKEYDGIPPELDEQELRQGEACAVPAYLND